MSHIAHMQTSITTTTKYDIHSKSSSSGNRGGGGCGNELLAVNLILRASKLSYQSQEMDILIMAHMPNSLIIKLLFVIIIVVVIILLKSFTYDAFKIRYQRRWKNIPTAGEININLGKDIDGMRMDTLLKEKGSSESFLTMTVLSICTSPKETA